MEGRPGGFSWRGASVGSGRAFYVARKVGSLGAWGRASSHPAFPRPSPSPPAPARARRGPGLDGDVCQGPRRPGLAGDADLPPARGRTAPERQGLGPVGTPLVVVTTRGLARVEAAEGRDV